MSRGVAVCVGAAVLLALSGPALARSAAQPGVHAASAGAAQQAGQPATSRDLLHREHAFLDGVEAEMLAGDPHAAARRLASVEYDTASGFIRARFLLGMAYRRMAQPQRAVPIFREILAAHPGFPRVRLELAQALAEAGEYESARFHIQHVIAAGVDDTVEGRLRAMDRSLLAMRPWQFSAHVSVAPSTNINSGTSATSFTVGGLPFVPANRQKSGVGLRYGADLGYRHELGGPLSLLFAGGFAQTDHQHVVYDHTYGYVSAGPQISLRTGRVGLDFSYGRSLEGGRLAVSTFGATAYTRVALTPQTRIDLSVGVFEDTHDFRPYYNGHRLSLQGKLDRFLSSTSFVRLIAGYGRTSTEALHFRSNAFTGGLGWYNEFRWGLTGYAEVTYRHAPFVHVFPGLNAPRLDRGVVGRLVITKRDLDLWGFAPQVELSLARTWSNMPLYAYDNRTVNMRLIKDF
ncbi:MAG TPA: porin family protein [Xanthobacteraceae bacterium]|nr:porin family protein [Xanthobacteraceae bacterium]